MHELVIVVSDFYVSQETSEQELPAGVALPGLQHVARFGARSRIAEGWRSWIARWLTGQDAGAPAAVAAVTLQPGRLPMAWMATPMHLVAGLTSVHVDRRSVLRLDASDQSALTTDFQRVFHDSGFELCPLDSGDFLVLGPPMPHAETFEPARSMGASLADARGASLPDPALRRLGAEIEMWLHDHPVNEARSRRGEWPVTGLWLWGGGPRAVVPEAVPAHAASSELTGVTAVGVARGVSDERASNGPASTPLTDIAFGRDAYLQGLWALRDEKVFPLPQQLADVFGYPQARRAVVVIEIGSMLHSNPRWTFFDAVAQIDRSCIAPAIDALSRGQCERLVVLANDRQLSLRARDRLKFWRRTPSGLSGLQ